MSRYSDYQKKLIPWVKAKNFLFRHRVIIIATSAALFCAAITLTSTKGIVKEEDAIKDHVTYGETLSYRASAFLGKASYEYSPASEDSWSSLVPVDAGSYKMRAKGDNSFGGSYYGEIHFFTIDPYETSCELASTSFSYGSKPSLKIELVNGDEVGSYDLVYDDISLDKPTASIENLKIVNKAGGDVTNNYKVNLSSSVVSLSKGSLTFTFPTRTYVYDASSHSLEGDDYTYKGNLASGDSIEFEKNSIINAGSCVAVKDGSIKIKHGEKDVTNHYSIYANYGSLKVNQASITLSSASFTKVYDGLPISESDYQSCEKTGLIGSDDVNLAYEDISSFVSPGTKKNAFSYTFADADAEPNYSVSAIPGDLTITKRPVIVSISGTHVYEGSDFAGEIPSSEVACDNLVFGHKATCYVESSEEDHCLKNTQEVRCRIEDRDGKDVTNCYQISIDGSGLVYAPKEVTITAESVSATYDGASHQGKFTWTGLADGDEPRFSAAPSYSEINEDGTALVKAYKPQDYFQGIFNSSSGKDRTDYYDITFKEGTITLSPRPMSIELKVNRDYETYGTSMYAALSGAEYRVLNTADNEGLVEGQSITIAPSDIYSSPKFDVKVYDGTKDVTHNYALQLDPNSPAFTKSQILVSGLTPEAITYDGKAHQISPTVSGLRSGDKVVWETNHGPDDTSKIKAGTYPFTLEIKKIENASGEDVTEHYDYASPLSATLVISKASPVTVTLTISRDYDGSRFTPVYGNDFISSGNMANDSVSIVLNEDPYLHKDSTDFDITVTNSILNEKVNDCYEGFTKLNKNSYAWTPGPVEVKAVSTTVTYDGEETKTTVDVSGLAAYDYVSFKLNGESRTSKNGSSNEVKAPSTDVGKYDLTITDVEVKHSYNNGDAKAYYSSITSPEDASGSITITPRPITLDIYEHGKNEAAYALLSGTTLAKNQLIKLTYSAVDNAVDKVKYNVTIYDGNSKDVTKNYAITINSEPTDCIPLEMKCVDKTIAYDGYEHSYAEYPESISHSDFPTYCNLKKGENSTKGVTLADNPEDSKVKFAGDTKTFTPSVKSIVDPTDGTDETALYKVTVVPGTLTVRKRKITITISGSMTYEGYLFSNYSVSGVLVGGEALAGTDKMTITPKDDGTGSIIGKADADDFSIAITDKATGEDRKDNYEIETITVDYEFLQGSVKVPSVGNSYVYDGQEHSGKACAEGLGNDKVTSQASASSSETEVGTYEYQITVSSVSSSEGEDRSPYYKLPDTRSSAFEITARPVTIDFGDDFNVVETGSPIDLNKRLSALSPQPSNLPDGFSVIDYRFSDGGTTPGTYSFSDVLSSYKIIDKNGVDRTKNFSVTVTGTYEIKEKIKISVWFTNAAKTYDGKAYSGSFGWKSSYIPNGYELKFTGSVICPTNINVGTHQAQVLASSFSLVDLTAGETLTDESYEITFVNQPSVTITKCKLTFQTKTLAYGIFEGETCEVPCEGADPLSSGLTEISENKFTCNNGDIIELIPSQKVYEFTSAGTIGNGSEQNPWKYKVTRNGNDVSSNYDIAFSYGTITVEEVTF